MSEHTLKTARLGYSAFIVSVLAVVTLAAIGISKELGADHDLGILLPLSFALMSGPAGIVISIASLLRGENPRWPAITALVLNTIPTACVVYLQVVSPR